MARSPADLSPLRWWRSTEGLVAEMGAVAGWADRVAGAVLAQPNMLNRPQIVAAADAGGVTALNFLGNGMTQLVLDSLPANQTYTIVAVAATREGGRTQTLTKSLGSGGGSSGEMGLAIDAAPARWRLFAGGTYNAATGRLPLNTRVIVAGRFAGSSSLLTINGSKAATGSAGVRAMGGAFHVGWDPATSTNGNRAWNGLLWELIVFDRALTDAEMAALDSYAQDRYPGLTVSDYVADVDRRSGSGKLTTTPTLSGRGVVRKRGSGSLSTSATKLSGTGRPTRRGTGSLVTTARLAATGRAMRRGQGRLGLTPTLSATGRASRRGSGLLPTAPTLAAHGVARLRGVGRLSVSPILTGAGSPGVRYGLGVLRTRPTLRGSGTSVFTGQGVLPLGDLLAGSGRAHRAGEGLLPVEASLSGTGKARKRGSGRLDVEPWLSGQGLAQRVGRGVLGLGVTLAGFGVKLADFLKRDVDVEVTTGDARWTLSDGDARWEIGEGSPRWEIGVEPMVYKVDRNSREYVPIDVTSTFADTGEDSPVSLRTQFTEPGVRYDPAKWEGAVVQPTLEGGAGQGLARYRADLGPGKYDIWAEVTTADEVVPRKAGTLNVT